MRGLAPGGAPIQKNLQKQSFADLISDADEAFIGTVNSDMNPTTEEEPAMTHIDSHTAADGAIYRIADLEEAFRKVHDPDDWKAPIAVWCAGESVLPICEAIRFFTATEPKVELDTTRMRYLITSEGYRAGPAGDH